MIKIWYEDNELIVNSLEEWINAPYEGVVGIYEFFENIDGINYGRISMGSDWYWMLPDKNINHNLDSSEIVDNWLEVNIPEGAYEKKGKYVSDKRINEVNDEIKNIIENGIQ
jgi:hypothetical protein